MHAKNKILSGSLLCSKDSGINIAGELTSVGSEYKIQRNLSLKYLAHKKILKANLLEIF